MCLFCSVFEIVNYTTHIHTVLTVCVFTHIDNFIAT